MRPAVLSTEESSRKIEEVRALLVSEIARLEGQLAEATRNTASEVARLEAQIAVAEKTAASDKEIALLQAESQNVEKRVREAESLRQETKRDIFRINAIGAAVALVLSVIGYTTIKGYYQHIVATRIDPLVTFQYAYSRGTGMLAWGKADEAASLLLQCFPGHEYDDTVVQPLMAAVVLSNNTTTEKWVVDEILRRRDKLDDLKRPDTWNNLAAAEMALGTVSPPQPAYLVYAKEALDRAHSLVEQWDVVDQRSIELNSWVLAIVTRRPDEARAAVMELMKINDKSIPVWEEVREYSSLREYLKTNPAAGIAARNMWKQLEAARAKETPEAIQNLP